MLFKRGDKVIIREDLSPDNTYIAYGERLDQTLNCVGMMQKLRGERAVITKVFPDEGMYHLDICSWAYWCDEMLEPIQKNKYKIKGV